MKKKQLFGTWDNYVLKKMWKIMRVGTMLLYLCMMQLYANTSYSQQTVISLNVKSQTVLEVIKEIEKNSNVKFFFSPEKVDLKRTVSLQVQDKSVEEVLDALFQDTNVVYQKVDNTVVLKNVLKQFKDVDVAKQSITVTGKVTDQSGEPLPGVSVVVKGTTVGVTTDFDGKYSLNLPDGAEALVFSFVGMKKEEINIDGQSVINLAMTEDAIGIKEVIAVGYGTIRRSDVTAAIASISSEDIEEKPVLKVSDALQGKIAGVSIASQSGSPGATPVIRIRGANSINGSNAPLVVIDGLIGGNIATLNPNDIESVEVLKDASATAIYGSRGANGVILISTKTGGDGRTVVELNSYVGFQSLSKKIEILDAVGYATAANYRRTVGKAGDINVTNYEPRLYYSEETLSKLRNGEMHVDWQDEVYETAVLSNHQFSVKGGNKMSKFLISGNYVDQDGIMINSGYKKYSGRIKVDTQLSKKFNFGVNGVGVREVSNPANSNVAFNATYALPTGWVYKEDGSYFNNRESYADWGESSPNSKWRLWNPVAQALEATRDVYTTGADILSYLEYEVMTGLKIRILGSGRYSDSNDNGYYNEHTSTGWGQKSVAEISNARTMSWQNSNIITYEKKFTDHNLKATALFEQQHDTWEGNRIKARGFLNDINLYHSIQSAETVLEKSSYKGESSILSYLGRVNYGFKNKYLLTAALRADGSSKFGENNKWGYFPSASFAWRMSEENFMSSMENVTDFKVRFSWGITGSQAISPYETISKLSVGGAWNNYPIDGNNLLVGSRINGMANEDLKWEKTTQTNIGFDLGLFNNRVNIVADYYYKKTDDLLLNVSLPRYSGFSSVRANIGEVENKGWELMINTTPSVGALEWDLAFNISGNKNKVIALSTENEDKIPSSFDISYVQKGQPLGAFYGYEYLGVFLSGEEAEAAKYGQTIGSTKIADLNNDGKFTVEDKTVIGDPNPDFIFGLSNKFSYNHFDLSFFIQGSVGNDIYNYAARNRFDFENTGTTGYRNKERWHPTDHPDGYYQRYDYSSTLNNAFYRKEAQKSTIFVEDGSYVRLKNVTFSYNLPNRIIDRFGLSNVRLYASADNLVTISDYWGYDPELGSSENDASKGVDNTYYPIAKTVMFGVDIKF